MLRYIAGLFLLSSCSLGVIRNGGEKPYLYNSKRVYKAEELKDLAPSLVESSQRNPQNGKLEELFSSKQPPIKRVGILVFETSLQPTRGGLSGDDKVYLSAQGKQLITEKLLSIWEQSFSTLTTEVELVKVSQIKKSKSLLAYGMDVTDHILVKREGLAPDDVFFLPKGKETTSTTILNPRGMRDLSLALIPATEFMIGPKFSEHAKHAVNDVARELKLDAVIVVMSDLFWTAAHTDKHSGEVFAEEAVVKIKSSILVPLHSYHDRLKNLGEKRSFPSATLAFKTYEVKVKAPIVITVGEEKQNFKYIEDEIVGPILKTYADLTQMVEHLMIKDMREASR